MLSSCLRLRTGMQASGRAVPLLQGRRTLLHHETNRWRGGRAIILSEMFYEIQMRVERIQYTDGYDGLIGSAQGERNRRVSYVTQQYEKEKDLVCAGRRLVSALRMSTCYAGRGILARFPGRPAVLKESPGGPGIEQNADLPGDGSYECTAADLGNSFLVSWPGPPCQVR